MSYDETMDTEARISVRPRGKGGLDGRQSRVWSAAETLDNTLDSLSHRLGPVLLPERPSPALGAVTQDSPDASELAQFLDNLADKLTRLGERAADLAGRIDL